MKRTLTLTFEFDDAPWYSEETEEWHPTDAIAYAMDQVNSAASMIYPDVAFIDAKLDGEVLVDGFGYVSEEVQKREVQHRAFLKEVMS